MTFELSPALLCSRSSQYNCPFFFFFTDTATTEIYTLSLHDALPISVSPASEVCAAQLWRWIKPAARRDRKSTRLNSSHTVISYAVFCLKKKKTRAMFPTVETECRRRRARRLRWQVLRCCARVPS